MLDVQDITVAYSSNAEPTIEGFHLKMKPGEICSIVGESGSGKTTVIRSILGLLPSGGKKEIFFLRENRYFNIQKSSGENLEGHRFP